MQPGGDQQGVLSFLQGLLAQLEGAQGGQPDSEARQKLEALRAQLQLMEAVQQGRPPPANVAPRALHTEVAVAQEIDSLDTRLTQLEQRLDGLDPEARQVVQQSVAGWVGSEEGPAAAAGSASSQPGDAS